jgi:hypothetical protein
MTDLPDDPNQDKKRSGLQTFIRNLFIGISIIGIILGCLVLFAIFLCFATLSGF